MIHLGHDGRVLEMSLGAEGALDPLIRIAASPHRAALQLRAASSSDQRRLNDGLRAALQARKPGLVSFAADRASFRLLVVPVLGQAQDVFNATAAVATVLDANCPGRLDRDTAELLASSAGLTRREVRTRRLGQLIGGVHHVLQQRISGAADGTRSRALPNLRSAGWGGRRRV